MFIFALPLKTKKKKTYKGENNISIRKRRGDKDYCKHLFLSMFLLCLLFSFPDLSEVALTGDMEVKLNLVTQENLKRIIIKFSDN